MKSPPPFGISRIDTALASQARFYIYGQQSVSKRTFEDPAFIEMLVSSYVAGGGEAKNAPKLTVKALKLYMVEEFEIFKGYMKMIINDMLAFTEGNPFAQCLNAACTLAYYHNCMAIGMEFVDCIHFKSHAVCLGMVPLADDTDNVDAKTIETVMTEVTGFTYNQIMTSGSIGGSLASSFCQRINSCAKLVLTDGNSLLSPDEINMLVTLRMNRKFMQFMRENHAKDGHHTSD
jgi:hypothetical protein